VSPTRLASTFICGAVGRFSDHESARRTGEQPLLGVDPTVVSPSAMEVLTCCLNETCV